MNFQNLLTYALVFNQTINHFTTLPTIASIQLRGTHQKNLLDNTAAEFINASPNNTWLLRETGDSMDYMLTNFYLVLLAGESQLFEFNSPLEYFVYEVCDTTGPASVLYVNGSPHKCAVASGALINITATIAGMNVTAIKDTAIESVSISGTHSPYYIKATPTPAPICDIPYPQQYADGKQRIINLEGATLNEPKFPHVCDVSYFAQAGANTIRFPFKWDYLQNFVGQDIPIDWSSGGYGAQMIKLTNAWTEKNYTVILSMYNHMRYSYCEIGASDCWVDQARYATAWKQIATQFVNNSRVIFGLMNEPEVYDIIDGYNNGTTIALNNQNAAAQAIRSVGAKQLILYAGNGRSKIENWNSNEYGEPNSQAFMPQNISDNHYGIDVQMFYTAPETLIEDGCFSSSENNENSCVNQQNSDDFITWMNNTGIPVVIGQTGGTNSLDCIICINYGTAWMMIQRNITGIGMWTGGHAWLDFNGSTQYPLYLAPIHNIAQKQMTLGFQNVTNPKTGEYFLVALSSTTPSTAPTRSSGNKSFTKDFFSWQWASIYTASGAVLLAMLYFIYHYNNKKKSSLLSINYCGYFGRERSLIKTPLLNNSPSEMKNSV